MSNRYAEVVIVAEDERSANFLRRYTLRALRIDNRRVRQLISPSARGDAKRWVINRYPIEVKALRCKHSKVGLIVHIDADNETVVERVRQLAFALKNDGQKARETSERICHVIPKRHTETWLCVLTGIDVAEDLDCKRQRLPPNPNKAVNPAAEALYQLTRANVAAPLLPSLASAISDLQRLEN